MLRLFFRTVLKLLDISAALLVHKASCTGISTLGGSDKVSQKKQQGWTLCKEALPGRGQ